MTERKFFNEGDIWDDNNNRNIEGLLFKENLC